MNLSELWEMVKNREGWCAEVHGVTESGMTERLHSNTTKAMRKASSFLFLMRSWFFCGVWGWAALGLGYCAQSFSSCSERGQLFCGTVASHAEHRLQHVQALVVVARGL